MKLKILIGIPPKNHVNLAMDELQGLKDLGYECSTIAYTRNNQHLSKLNKLFGVLSNAIGLVKKLHKINPDILYLNSRFEPLGSTRDYISIILIKLFYYKKLKIAIKSHGSNFDIFTTNSFFFNFLVLPFLTKQVSIWWFLSEDEIKTVAHYHPKMGSNSYVTFNIIDPKRSKGSRLFSETHGLLKSKFSFLFIGRMVREKGLFSLLRSIPEFKYKDNCQFVLVGNGNDMDELKKLTIELNLQKIVRFLGFIQEEECDHFYANTDALVFPSHDEGFAMALFKAIASGMPVITTQIRAAKDQLKSPDNCLWVKIGSHKDLTTTMTQLYEDEKLRSKMSSNNLMLGERFSKKSVCIGMHKVFQKVI